MLVHTVLVASSPAITKTFLEHGADIETVESTTGAPIEDILRQQPGNATRQPVPRGNAGSYARMPESSVGH